MSVCCNLDCDKVAINKAKRCGTCRKVKRYICAICGESVDNVKKIFCSDCAHMSKMRWAEEYRRNYYVKIGRSIYMKRRYIKHKQLNKTKDIILQCQN